MGADHHNDENKEYSAITTQRPKRAHHYERCPLLGEERMSKNPHATFAFDPLRTLPESLKSVENNRSVSLDDSASQIGQR